MSTDAENKTPGSADYEDCLWEYLDKQDWRFKELSRLAAVADLMRHPELSMVDRPSTVPISDRPDRGAEMTTRQKVIAIKRALKDQGTKVRITLEATRTDQTAVTISFTVHAERLATWKKDVLNKAAAILLGLALNKAISPTV